MAGRDHRRTGASLLVIMSKPIRYKPATGSHYSLPPMPYPVKTHQLDQEVQPVNPRRKKRHEYKDPHNRFYKQTLSAFAEPPADKLLDGFLLLDAAKVDHPHEAIRVRLPGERLGRVEAEDLKYFTNLSSLYLPDNHLQLNDLKSLTSLVELDLMCNQIASLTETPEMKQLETLTLSYNRIPADQINRLAALPRLTNLDLSYNDLYTLPEDMSKFRELKTLALSGNAFSTDSVLFSPASLFASLSTLPQLTKLNLSRNKLRGINADGFTSKDFRVLEELDFSYNWVDDPGALLAATLFPALQLLIVTGNPFALRKDTESLDLALSGTSGAVVINALDEEKKKEKAPYPKPVAIIAQDYNAVLKTQLFGVELSKEMGTLALNDLKGHSEAADLFPEEELPAYKDIYTPSSASRPVRSKPNVFLTESEGTQELGKTPAAPTISRLEQFRRMARQLLSGETEYEKPLSLATAYQQLRHIVQYPLTYQGKSLQNYEKNTATRKHYGAMVQFHAPPVSKQKALPMQRMQEELESVNQQLALPRPPLTH